MIFDSFDFDFVNKFSKLKLKSLNIESLTGNIASFQSLINNQDTALNEPGKADSSDLDISIESIFIHGFLEKSHDLKAENLSFKTKDSSLRLKQLNLTNAESFFIVKNISLLNDTLIANIKSENFNFTKIPSSIGFTDFKLGTLTINKMNLNYQLLRENLNGDFDFHIQDPSVKTLNFFRTILARAFDDDFNINNRKNAYIKAKGEFKDSIAYIQELNSKSNLYSFSANGSLGVFDQKLDLLIKLKGVEHFIPLETLKLDYIIPGDLIPISVKGTIAEPKVSLALSKVVTTVEPKLLKKVQDSFMELLFNKK